MSHDADEAIGKGLTKKLPKTLRAAMDSSPLEGAGRVEDTIKASAIPTVIAELTSLEQWVTARLPEELTRPPLKEQVATLRQIIGQDLEPEPDGSGRMRIRDGVAEDRRVSIEDKEMRHGRKTKSKRFNGYKRHLAIDLDTVLVLAVAVLPANRPEQEAASSLVADITAQGLTITSLYIDRGYINAPIVDEILARRGTIICRPWLAHNGRHFSKRAFKLNMRDRTITCPAGEQQAIVLGAKVEFAADRCRVCPLRAKCTDAAPDRGRTVAIADNELLQHRLRKQAATPAGRQELRQRVPVEHRQAHTCRRQGRHARYIGSRKNEFDLRRASAISNFEVIQRTLEASSPTATWARAA